MHPLTLILISIVGICIGIVGVAAGGSALITIPFLLILGLDPYTAIATTKFATIGSFITGGIKYQKAGILKNKKIIIMLLPAVLGAIIGARSVLKINEDILRPSIIVLLILILVIVVVNKKLGLENKTIDLTHQRYLLSFIVIFLLGLYSGFFGAGFGILTILALIYLFGSTFLESAAMMMVINFSVMLVALIIFAYNGVINYTIGIPLFFSTAVGGWIGAHIAVLKGNIWIRRLFILITLALIIRLILE
jgi:hypothetical protein